MRKITTLSLCLMIFGLSSPAIAQEGFKDIAGDYLEFATYSDGVLSPQQLDQIGLENVTLINTSSEDGYQKSMIPGSIHIDWREVLERSDEIPKDGVVVVYCKNSLVSAKAQLLLSLAGYENVRVLSRGYTGWTQYQSQQNSENS